MNKGNLDIDPRGLIFESYRIDGIRIEECRSIFLDWALNVPGVADMKDNLQVLLTEYEANNPGHPMSAIIREGLETSAQPKRRGGRTARVPQG